MSIVKCNNAQIGQSLTATNNFCWYQPSSPDGTVRLAVGNAGATTLDTVTVNSSGNVGIGTSSPATKLHVSSTGSTPGLIERTGSNGVYLQLKDASGSSVYLGATNGVFAIQTPGSSYSDKLVVDSSGNLGLGVTPSAWDFGGNLVLPGAGTYIASKNINITFGANLAYTGGAEKYVASNPASKYLQGSGTHSWYTAPSGTAGNAISFTQAMTLNASGYLGIGATSPGCRLDVAGTVRAYNSDNWNYSNLNLVRNATNTSFPRFLSFMLDGDSDTSTTIGGYPAIWGIYSGTPTTGSTSSGLSAKMGLASYAGFNFYINGTQSMTLDASGQFMLGTTSASSYANTGKVLTISGTAFNTGPANLYLQGNTSAPGRGFNATELFAISGISSANEITRITGTGSNGFRAYIKIIVTGHNSGLGNGTNIKEFYWDGGNAAPVQISTYTDGQVPPITFNYSTANVLIIYLASSNGTNEFKGVMKVEWMLPNDFSSNTWVIS